MEQSGKNVLIALSGGVDSSVSAALLKEQGYHVEAAFIVTWTAPWLPCTWREERRDAMRVAAHLKIPFHTVDLSKEYERDVVEYLVREYKKGRTPNPDVMCNKHIKFGVFFDWAIEQGFDYIATGHYTRIREISNPKSQAPNKYALLSGVDKNKDQSYFLWTLTQRHLAHTLFPVGEYQKQEVRERAKHFGLPTADKKDSQGVCFLGKIDMKEFLQHYIPPHPGNVIDEMGRVIGTHDGAAYVTLGQRHGFSVSAHTPDTPPLYVTTKDVHTNTITVAPKHAQPEKHTEPQTITLTNLHWIADCPEVGGTFSARLRYRQTLFLVVINSITPDAAVLTIPSPQRYIPTGQSLVLYDDTVCLGGGVI